MLRRETKPNAVTWFVWLILQIIATLAQISSGASWSLIILVVMIFNISLVLVLISLGYGYKQYHKVDYVCFFLAITSLILWQITGEPVLAIILAVLTDLFAIIPTIIKTYKEPSSENLVSWILNVLAAILACFSTTIIDVANLAFPIYYIMTDSTMVYLIYRGQSGKKELRIMG